jgi:hypothetical protein
LRPLHGIQESESRIDDARVRPIAAELDADGAMQLDDVLNGQVMDGVFSR